MAFQSHLYRRGASYVWRRRIPALVGGRILQISLRTNEPLIARRRAAIVTAESNNLFDAMTVQGLTIARSCHDAIAARGAAAIIPPRKNARLWKPTTDGARARNDALQTSKRLGRSLWRKWSGYHRRSRVEAKMNCIELLGQRLMARAFDRQVAEVQIRAAILNCFTALGTPVTAIVA